MTIGEMIFKYRKQAGLSQEELAYKVNVTRQSVSLWETDQTMPSMESMMMLSEIFGVSLDELCGTGSKDVETAPPCAPEKSECLVCVQTKYTVDLVKHTNIIAARKSFAIDIIAILLSIFFCLVIILSDIDNVYFVVPIFIIVILSAIIVRLIISIKKRTAEFFALYPNCIGKIQMFQDRCELDIISDNSSSKATIRYSDVKEVVNDEKYVLIYFDRTVIPIEKNLPDINYDLILKLLGAPSVDADTSKKRAIKVLLSTIFVISLLSIFMALMTVWICTENAPLPDYPFSMPEYMWILYLFIPLPLASAILGTIFYAKKYKCKKNIIGGSIMCVLLLLFGSFTFIFKEYNLHDFGYVRELEQTISIDFPDSGYISQTKNFDSATNSFAMIKFDDAKATYNIVAADGRFSTDADFIPSNFINLFFANITSDYDFFMLYDVTSNKTNVIPNNSPPHRFIFIAYHVDDNILFVLDFVK
ncbi:MAG: helix-turn-helix domain-containing protein [Clostridiales bacterium]|nr:helix-turn-helix domain-containing protein [Clostridiales bacterium]